MPVFWSGETTIGANPLCSRAYRVSTATALLALKNRVGLPGWPESMTSTGSTGGWAASAAGGSQTTAWRARNPECVAGIVALNSLPSVSGRTDPERTWVFHFPAIYGNVLAVDGELAPTAGSRQSMISDYFGGDAAAYDRQVPVNAIKAHAPSRRQHERGEQTGQVERAQRGAQFGIRQALVLHRVEQPPAQVDGHEPGGDPEREPAIGIGGGLLLCAGISTLFGDRALTSQIVFSLSPVTLVAGALMASTAFSYALWRHRVRLIGYTAVLVVILYGGNPGDYCTLIAAVAGQLIGTAHRRQCSPPRRRACPT